MVQSMNAVEIEEAVSRLAEEPFDPAEFPATITDLYAPGNMPANLREAHDRNDEILERIYIKNC
jgi:hypothetical protein